MDDSILLGKLSGGDLIAQDAMYHRDCYIGLRNKVRKIENKEGVNDDRRKFESIALAEVLSYILSRLSQLPGVHVSRINTFTLKNKILVENLQYLLVRKVRLM